ncbi:MAG: hypothetical protein EOM29_09585 [Bacteroidia bacterium]|jgi:hypothetical protein|nr:hypothetical protein [Bacteroidia bacterium]
MNKYRIENPNNNKVREYKSRTTDVILNKKELKDTLGGGKPNNSDEVGYSDTANGSHYDRVTLLDSKDTFESRDNPNYIPHMVDIGEKFI